MRENIGIFRGKRKDNGEWVEGYLSAACDCTGRAWFIYVPAADPDDINHRYDIDPETVGEFTGLTDCNGKRIFEGDICHFYGGEHYMGCWEANLIKKIELCHGSLWYLENAEYVEVIGNIHDNPELLERERERETL